MTEPQDRDRTEPEQSATAADDHLLGDRDEDDVEGHAYTGALQDKNQQP